MCIPFNDNKEGKCIFTGKLAKKVLFARSY
ncbi:hypothetical protein HYT24_02625 [Candidatus Pacearchaeota archaeon]|nr:hypothetical protein [Candidatus Pacearchaeota archaeon]